MFAVSPLNSQSYLDFNFYLDSLERYQLFSIGELFQEFVAFYLQPFSEQFGHIISGPVFPLLIGVFDYSPVNTLPLALFFLVFNTAITLAWLKWLDEKGVWGGWLILFAIIPNPIWFVLVLSPDSLFAGFVCAFYLAYFEDRNNTRSLVVCCLALFLALLTRPNGFSILLFVLVVSSWMYFVERRIRIWSWIAVVLVTAGFSLYMYPYFITEMRKSSTLTVYYGYEASEYAKGLFHSLPSWLDYTLSWVAFATAKIFYLVGLRPSSGGTLLSLVVIRSLPGLILLPGLFRLLIFAPWQERVFVGIFLLPIILGPTQDRYILPIIPILFLHGTIVYTYIWRRWLTISRGTRLIS